MGTPEFAVTSLQYLVETKYNIVGVVTIPDKPAGRGQQLQQSAIKKYAVHNNIPVLQPEKLKDPSFLQQLKNLNPELQIVVAFRMLPEIVWALPKYGTFNLHASLLPQYRGAAPINWAIINGEKESGTTTFFLKHEIDTGKIIFQKKITLADNETAGSLHDKLMTEGAMLVKKTIDAIASGNCPQTDQETITNSINTLKTAPKIFKENCKINWSKPISEIHNLIRGLSPYPTAWTEIKINNKETVSFKIFDVSVEKVEHHLKAGTIIINKKNLFKIAANGGFIYVLNLQQAGKKRMNTNDFLCGFNFTEIELS